MNAANVGEIGDQILVEFPAADGYRNVGRLVVGGLASRFQLPVDRVEELLLALESALLDDLAGDVIQLSASAGADGLRVRVGPFLRPRLGDPAVERVLVRLVDGVSETGDVEGGTWVELDVRAARLSAGR